MTICSSTIAVADDCPSPRVLAISQSVPAPCKRRKSPALPGAVAQPRRRYSPPCITRKEGWLRHQELARSHQSRRRRSDFPFADRETTPSSLSKEASRHFLIARPPLLAVMQGGEYASAL